MTSLALRLGPGRDHASRVAELGGRRGRTRHDSFRPRGAALSTRTARQPGGRGRAWRSATGCRSSASSPPAGPTSTRAWPPCTAGARRPGPSPPAPAWCRCWSPSPARPCRGPALLLGLADVVVLTEDASAFVVGPGTVADVHRRAARRRRARRRRRALRRNSGVAAPVVADEDGGTRLPRRPCSPTCPTPATTSRRRWSTADPVDRPTPEARRPGPGRRHRQLRRARRGPGHRRRRRAPRAVGAAGHRTSSPPSPRSAGSPSASWPTSPSPWPARSTSRASQKGARFVALCDAFNVPIAHARRHARLLPRQGPRVARDDPPRRPAGRRLRPGHRAPGVRRAAQGLRRRLHRHGLQAHGQRPLPGLAVAPSSR